MSRRNAYVVFLVISGASSAFMGLYGTVSAVYRVQAAGLNPLQLVLVGTVLEAVCIITGIPTGLVADLYSRKLSVVIGLFLMGVGFVLEGAVPRFEIILLAQAVWGIGAMFVDGAQEAWIAGEIGEQRITHVFLRAAQAGQVAGIAGVIGAGLLASIRLNLPLVTGGVLMVALAFYALAAMPENAIQPAQRDERSAWGRMSRTVRESGRLIRHSPILLTLILVAAFMGMSSEGFDRLWEAHFLADVHFPALGGLKPVMWFSMLVVGAQLLSLVGTEIARRRVITRDSVSAARTLLLLNALLIGSVVVLGLAVSFPLALAAYWGSAVTRQISSPIYTGWLTESTDPRLRATVFSVYSQSDALGQIAGGPVIGAVGTIFNLRAALVATALTLLPALPLFARTARREAAASEPLIAADTATAEVEAVTAPHDV